MEHLVLNDNSGDGLDDFISGLEAETGFSWHLANWIANQPRTGLMSEVKRYMRYIFKPFKLVTNSHIESIVAWQQFYGVSYAFWNRLFRSRKKSQLTIMTFIYKQKQGLAGKLFHFFVNYAISSPYVDTIICTTSSECEKYRRAFPDAAHKFVFTPISVVDAAKGRVGSSSPEPNSVIAAGRSNRDYDFLIEELGGTDYKVEIIDDSFSSRREVPSNIRLISNLHGEKYLDHLANCWACVIPIDDPTVGSGQSVLLQAWALGRPVLCTRCEVLEGDYVHAGVDALVVDKKPGAMRQALDELRSDSALWESLSKTGRQQMEASHSLRALGEFVGGTF